MAILSALASLVLTASAALADGTIDQSQALHTNGAEGTCGDERLAQIVNGGLTGALDRVDLHIWRDDSNATADLHVEIQTALLGYPTGTALASATVPLSNVGTDSRTSAFVTARFDPPAMVRAGQQYAIVVLESGLTCTQGYWWSFVDGLAYPGGDALSHSGGSWFYLGGDNGQDFAFKTYVDTSFPSVDIPNVFPRLRVDGIAQTFPGMHGSVSKDPVAEASSALQQLGYRPVEVARLIKDVAEAGDSAEGIIRKALKAALR